MEPFSKSYRSVAYSRRYNYPNTNKDIRPDHSAIIEADDLAALIRGLKLKSLHIVGASYGAFTTLVLAIQHPELVRSLVLAEPPLLRWLPGIEGGEALLTDFMENCWQPTRVAFQSVNEKQALRTTLDWFVKSGYKLPGGVIAFDDLPEEFQRYLLGNATEWKALTSSKDAFPLTSRQDVKQMKIPVLLLSGEKTLKLHQLIDRELEKLLSNKERIIIPDASHDMWNDNPDLCQKATLGFIARH